MALINSLSTPSIRGEADLMSVPCTDTTVETSFYAEHKPIVNIQESDSKLEFRISGNSTQYLDFSDHFLEVDVQVVDAEGALLSAGADVSTSNNFMHSLFQQCDVYVGTKLVSSSNNSYPYKAIIQTIFSSGSDNLNSLGQCVLFYKDTEKGELSDRNTGYKKRKEFIAKSNHIQMIGKLKFDLASQSRYFLNDTPVTISLTRSSNAFALLWDLKTDTDPNINPRVKFHDASLYVRKQVLFPSISLSHQKSLQNGLSAQYPQLLSDVKQFTIPSGNQTFIEENVFLGNIPSHIIVCMVKNAAFNGSYKLNPFYFDHFNVNYVGLSVNNIPIPIKPLILDFKKGRHLLPYYLMLSSIGVTSENDGISISREDYANGNVFFSFDVNHMFSNSSSLVLENTGSVRIELKFETPLKEAVTCLVYSESQSILSIDKYRQATVT